MRVELRLDEAWKDDRHPDTLRGARRGVVARDSGFIGLTAPILDYEGAAVAALTINSTAAESASTDGTEALVAVARRVSWEIGHRSTPHVHAANTRKVV